MRWFTLFGVLVIVLLVGALFLSEKDREGHVTLLTFAEETGSGGTADLYLEIRPGTGKIYMDSFPLARLDTQSSTRYANRVACDFLKEDCTKYDFFYTIRANTAIVGGPSAGAAMTVLTIAVLEGHDIRQDVALTGTINSGGIIGPVAGVSQKIDGARDKGMTTVLVPSLVTGWNTTRNITENASSVASGVVLGIVSETPENGVDVVKVATIEDAMEVFTGVSYARELSPPVVDPEYRERMEQVADELCARNADLREQVNGHGKVYEDKSNYTDRISGTPEDEWYTRASLCFSSNIELNTLVKEESTQEELTEKRELLLKSLYIFDKETRERNITTISDLEVYSIVQERIIESGRLLNEADESNLTPRDIAYAEERLLSAISWSTFFGIPSKELLLEEEHLRNACLERISEAEERINYVRIYSEDIIVQAEGVLDDARKYSQVEPVLCIFSASKAKAQANLLASVLSISEDNLDTLIGIKIAAAERVVAIQQEEGFFPILGYSYIGYAENLRMHEPYSALTFAEYALEFSNLDMYFPEKNGHRLPVQMWNDLLLFAYGALFGLAVTALLLMRKSSR